MNTIRCPKCALINRENVGRCRRCGTALSPDKNGGAVDSKSRNFNRAARHLVVPAIVIVSMLCIYGYYRHSKSVPGPGAGTIAANKVMANSVPAGVELEKVKKMNRDFLAKLDQNMSDRHGEGFKKNQPLAFDMMMTLQEERNKLTDAAAQKYLDELHRLVNRYYDQLVRFNSEKADLADVSRQTTHEIEQIQQDPSLSDDEKYSRKRDLKRKYFDESQEYSVSSMDIDETVKSLRDLSASGTASPQQPQ